MEVVIAGGHGKVARRLSRRLHREGDRVRALIRNPPTRTGWAAGAEPVVCDLEQVNEDVLAATIAGADAVVFSAGRRTRQRAGAQVDGRLRRAPSSSCAPRRPTGSSAT